MPWCVLVSCGPRSFCPCLSVSVCLFACHKCLSREHSSFKSLHQLQLSAQRAQKPRRRERERRKTPHCRAGFRPPKPTRLFTRSLAICPMSLSVNSRSAVFRHVQLRFLSFLQMSGRKTVKTRQGIRQSAFPHRLTACSKKCEDPPSLRLCASPPCTSKRPLVTTSENHPHTSNSSRRKTVTHKHSSPRRE